jgi:hypothetical protein
VVLIARVAAKLVQRYVQTWRVAAPCDARALFVYDLGNRVTVDGFARYILAPAISGAGIIEARETARASALLRRPSSGERRGRARSAATSRSHEGQYDAALHERDPDRAEEVRRGIAFQRTPTHPGEHDSDVFRGSKSNALRRTDE